MTDDYPRKDSYWLLGGRYGNFFVCARYGGKEYTALCVFDSRDAAEDHLRSLSEPQMFLDTLEQYGSSIPSCLRDGPLWPEVHSVSRRGLWEAIKATGASYVVVNPPPADRRVETLKLLLAETFEPS
jgi:hypothetical protein